MSGKGSPITSQPSSRGSSRSGSARSKASGSGSEHSHSGSEHSDHSGNNSKSGSNASSRANSEGDLSQRDNDGILLPTPRQFLTPQDCPPGLHCLVEPEYVFLKQSYHSIEGMGIEGFTESTPKYEVLTIYGNRIFVVVEQKGAIMSKLFCTAGSPFSLVVYSKSDEQLNKYKKEVLQITGHPGSFGRGGYLDMTFDKQKLGRVEQDSDFTKIHYTIQNAEGKVVLKIMGPKRGNSCCAVPLANTLIHEFDVYLADGQTHVGRIAKHWSGVPNNKDVFTRSDIWGVKFPKEHDVKLKVSLMATIFLMYIFNVESHQQPRRAIDPTADDICERPLSRRST